MNLYMDDHPNRKTPEGWIRAWCVTQAIALIDRFSFDIISLDFDISIKVTLGVNESGYSEPRPFASNENFGAVARYIAAKFAHTDFKPKVILHTASPTGAQEMKNILEAVGIVPEIKLSAPCNKYEDEG